MTTSKNCVGAGGGLLGALGIHSGDGNQVSSRGSWGSHTGDTGTHSDFGGHLAVHHGNGFPVPDTSYFDYTSFPDATLTTTVHHAFNHVEIPLWGGVTISPVALVALTCLGMVTATSVAKRVVLWRVGNAVDS